ncbi:MAG: hypothetical protein E6X66_05685, partial [Streptococcus salivarius]|nr:hypothetical protein [Streptococcus salivarius]
AQIQINQTIIEPVIDGFKSYHWLLFKLIAATNLFRRQEDFKLSSISFFNSGVKQDFRPFCLALWSYCSCAKAAE